MKINVKFENNEQFTLSKIKNKNEVNYEGSGELTRKGDNLKGNVIISNLENFEINKYPLSIDLKKLKDQKLEEIIEKIVLIRIKIPITIKGQVKN